MKFLNSLTKNDIRPLFQILTKEQLENIALDRVIIASSSNSEKADILHKYNRYIYALYNEDIPLNTPFNNFEDVEILKRLYFNISSGLGNPKSKKLYKHYNISVYDSNDSSAVLRYSSKANISDEIKKISLRISSSLNIFLNSCVNSDFSEFVSIDRAQAKIFTSSAFPLLSALLNYNVPPSEYQTYFLEDVNYLLINDWSVYHENFQKFMEALSIGTINY